VSPPGWTARFVVTLDSAAAAEHLLAALGPEAAREVPKATATLGRPSPESVSIDVRASEPGALRAAANTYLGWVALASGAERAARRAEAGPSGPKPLSP
jgi:tRNA threonylcarbamoyladenosine modification (KEOPS) complex  Pcc1 subunit